jgi:Ca2+-binding EF-hand superfamily protein
MNKPLLLTGAFVALTMLVPTSGFSAAATGPKAKIFAEFDANKNGVIDGDEIAAVRKAYAADPKGQFARYDADHDGKLSDAEIAAIKPPGAKKAGEKKGGKKKTTETATETKPEQK